MRFTDIITTSSSNLWRNKGRTFLTVLAIFIGAVTLYLTLSIRTGVNNYIDKQITSIAGKDNSVLTITKLQDKSGGVLNTGEAKKFKEGDTQAQENSMYEKMSGNDVAKIKEVSGISDAVLSTSPTIDYIEGVNGEKYVTNINGQVFDNEIKLNLKAGRSVDNNSDNEINIPDSLVEPLGFKNANDAIDKTVKIRFSNIANDSKKVADVKIVGVLNRSLIQNGLTMVSSKVSKDIFEFQTAGMPESIRDTSYSASASVKKEDQNDAAVTRIKEDLKKAGYLAKTFKDQIKSIKDVVNAITGALAVFGAIALIAASFGIINTLFMSVRERTREIGLMKAVGMSNKKIFDLFSTEALLIGFWGSVLGTLIGMGIANTLSTFASKTFLKDLEGFTLADFSIWNVITIFIIVEIIAFLAGTLPSVKASKKDPIESLRYE